MPEKLTSPRKEAEPEEEQALIARVAGRDEEAFAELYQRYSGALFSLAVKMLQDAHEAEEAIQDVFCRVWKRAETYDRRRSAPFSWAVMITRCHCIDRLRSRARRNNRLRALPADDEGLSSPDESRKLLILSELSEQIREALASLPGKQQQCIELAFFRGLTQVEIAERLGLPLGTVKGQIRRGLPKLRALLQQQQKND